MLSKLSHPLFLSFAAYFEREMLKRQQSKEDEGIDVDDAIEKLDIEEHNPQKYLDILKRSVEGDGSKVNETMNVNKALLFGLRTSVYSMVKNKS